MNLKQNHIQSLIAQKAAELGFIKTGFTKYDVLEEETQKLRLWLDKGFAADMEWIERGFEKRKDVRNILPDAKSIISLAFNYYTPFEHDENKPKISRYAWGKDYHKVLKPKLKEISGLISRSGFKSLAYVDDGPVMDKVWAQKSGIGWMGKHTNIINPEYGSWFFICTIITNIEFDNYNKPIEDLCGECSLCISACPTGAITEEYVVNSNKCISYQTIENRGEIPAEINLDGWIFGCDVCQDVCPYNSPKYNHVTSEENFYPKPELLPLNKGECPKGEGVDILNITEEQFTAIFSGSPVKRTKYKGWKRNLERVRG
jgi:epoxyqueuosine reductase